MYVVRNLISKQRLDGAWVSRQTAHELADTAQRTRGGIWYVEYI